jgi:eukaryotic-like serine/threonine-protein kinase
VTSPSPATLLVVDDDPSNRVLLTRTLTGKGYDVREAASGEEALELARELQPTLILLDVVMPGLDGYEVCRRLKADPATQDCALVFLSAMGSAEDKVRGLELGGVDYLAKPFDRREVAARVETHVTIASLRRELRERQGTLEREIAVARALGADARDRLAGPLLGESPAVSALRARIGALAEGLSPVLLCGPAGAGQEAFARAIHESSTRAAGPFLRVDCLGATAPFGAEGWDPSSPWGLAQQGTIFFDALEALAPELQAELARRLEEPAPGPRVLASSRLGLERESPLGRLTLWKTLEVPALTERLEDVSELANFFLQRAARREGRELAGLSPAALRQLQSAPWAGNIDELEAVLDCALRTSPSPTVEVGQALLERGRRVGPYQLVERIGRGGMGEVWRATHRLLLCPAAVKLIRTDHLLEPSQQRQTLEQFELEARATASLESPHTVQLFDFGVAEGGTLYFAMELLKGLDLASLVRFRGPLPAARAIHFAIQACSSLGEAHAQGLLHRDIKPSNLFVAKIGTRHDVLKVLDFGLVLDAVWGERAGSDEPIGTPSFMAPEAAELESSPASDLYSLGCALFWILTGERVFPGASASDFFRAHYEDIPRRPSELSPTPVPAALDELVLALLEKRPEDRPASAEEVRETLRRLAEAAPWPQAQARAWWREHGAVAGVNEAQSDGTTRAR